MNLLWIAAWLVFAGAAAYGMIRILEVNSLLTTILYAAFLGALILSVFFQTVLGKKKVFRIRLLEEKLRDANVLQKRLKNSEEVALNYLPVGMVLYDPSFQIIWANNAAKDAFSNLLVDRNIALDHEPLAQLVEKKESQFIINIYGKDYDCIHYAKNRAIYLFEVTER
jgi:c-di-AMP phosphodiesterase-like protein